MVAAYRKARSCKTQQPCLEMIQGKDYVMSNIKELDNILVLKHQQNNISPSKKVF